MNTTRHDAAPNFPAYTRTAVALHWLIAILIIAAFTLGWSMADMKFSPTKLKLINWHKWVGVSVLLLATLRVLWRLKHQPPAPLPMPAWQQRAAQVMHLLLYVLLFVQPITGWLHSNAAGYPVVYFGVLPLPNLMEKSEQMAEFTEILHGAGASILFTLVALHLLAALKHHFKDRDNTLRRMLSWRG